MIQKHQIQSSIKVKLKEVAKTKLFFLFHAQFIFFFLIFVVSFYPSLLFSLPSSLPPFYIPIDLSIYTCVYGYFFFVFQPRANSITGLTVNNCSSPDVIACSFTSTVLVLFFLFFPSFFIFLFLAYTKFHQIFR